ncbi:tyrosine-type recombinase/integrase [Domibacillus enclensis]|uniref:Site-specific recombinase XerD n=1 Tax=Domibacillus enclensis TaxID=1017273 RepID=A0A1N6NIF6_9BACI|nr:tyrosine-type recombinase/integrase [Domibacillus enclensis]OXS80054.1 transposase [Domibacillus enclensis]SIP91860.1 Site-specific recombinase XerD [Domibacillus enclensis]
MENRQQKERLGFHKQLQKELSTYTEKHIDKKDGTIITKTIMDPYFLQNNVWNMDDLLKIENFSGNPPRHQTRKNLKFEIKNPNVNLEIKYVWYHRLFRDQWSLSTIFGIGASHLSKLTAFLNEQLGTVHSLLDVDVERTERDWVAWLSKKGYKTKKMGSYFYKEYVCQSPIAAFFRLVHKNLFLLTDFRPEWEKDRWDIRILHAQYGVNYNKSAAAYYLDFSGIKASPFRELVKHYVKQWLLNQHSFTAATDFIKHVALFINYLLSEEPSWKNLNSLKRRHVENYIGWIRHYSMNNKKIKHFESHIATNLHCVGKFLEHLYRYESTEGPEAHPSFLLFPEDRPKRKKKSHDQINYIPDTVLEQLFTYIQDLPKEAQPVVWVAFKTGMRISDVLGLTQDCLIKLNGKYYIETDIEKTFVIGHRVPIDDDLASIIAANINDSKVLSNDDNNPDKYIFVRYSGARKGKPYTPEWIRVKLNELAIAKNITDENGNLFHFKTHQFRHTYAVKMLNSGVDLVTVQELLAHASPEMTLRYAKLLDNTKRKAFEEAMKQGVFSFDLNGEVQEVKANEDIPSDILTTLWQDHKLNAIDNPYGSCHARLNGNCPYSEEPPCLTCNGGSPCKDLAIGFSDLDTQKYELLVKTTLKMIDSLKQVGRHEIAEKNKKNLNRYENILKTIKEGNIIFGRLERVNRKLGVQNGSL